MGRPWGIATVRDILESNPWAMLLSAAPLDELFLPIWKSDKVVCVRKGGGIVKATLRTDQAEMLAKIAELSCGDMTWDDVEGYGGSMVYLPYRGDEQPKLPEGFERGWAHGMSHLAAFRPSSRLDREVSAAAKLALQYKLAIQIHP